MAVFATARKLATLIYRLLRWGQPYVNEGVEAYERRYQGNRIASLKARAKELGYQIAPHQRMNTYHRERKSQASACSLPREFAANAVFADTLRKRSVCRVYPVQQSGGPGSTGFG